MGASGQRAVPIAIAGAVAALVLVALATPATAAGGLRLVSHVPGDASTTAAGLSASGVPSADGAFVVFVSTAANLVPGQVDANGDLDVFLLERASGTVALVSHTPESAVTTGDGISSFGAVGADGASVAFTSTSTNLVAGQADANDGADVFLFDRATGAIRLVSHAAGSPTTAAEGLSGSPSISGDGRFVAFQSTAVDLVPGQSDANLTYDAFLFERTTGAVTLASHAAAGATVAATAGAGVPTISRDGGWVVFASFSTNLVAGQADANGTFDVFRFERATGLVTLISHVPGSTTTTANGFSWAPSVSADGGAVAFQSDATNLVAGQADANGTFDVFGFQASTGATTLVSHRPFSATTTADGGGGIPTISSDGRVVAFPSFSTDLVAGQNDVNANSDVFVFDQPTSQVTLASHTPANSTTTGDGPSDAPSLSADGAIVVFHSHASNLAAGQNDANGDFDVFRHVRAGGEVSLVSHRPGDPATTAGAWSVLPRTDDTGTVVVFDSDAPDLVAGQIDANATTDVFVSSTTDDRSATPADFDGDGDTDVSVFRPSSGTWFIQGGPTTAWGTSGDIAVPGDYDGDGDTDLAVFRPSSGTWFVQGGPTTAWGTAGDIAVPGDYDGDGDTDLAVFRPSSGTWFVQGGPTTAWGTAGDIAVPGDYDGDGDTDLAVFRPSSGTWFIQGGPTTAWGTSGDIPVPGDYDGDTDLAVFRPSSGTWFIQGGPTTAWGTSGDIPVPGDYDGDGDTDLAVFRPSSGTWFIQGGPITAWGTSGDRPLPLPAAALG